MFSNCVTKSDILEQMCGGYLHNTNKTSSVFFLVFFIELVYLSFIVRTPG